LSDEDTPVTEQGAGNCVLFIYSIMKNYIKAQAKTDNLIVANKICADELKRFSLSDQRWADNRLNSFQTRTFLKGDIYQFEFGKNYVPEMSYEHRGMIIGVRKKLLYVLPIFSYNEEKHRDVFHPTDSPNSKSDLFLLKKEEYSFIKHDSVLKLNDMRSISINRALYPQGHFDIESDNYKLIEKLTMMKYFPEFARSYELLQKENADLKKKLAEECAVF